MDSKDSLQLKIDEAKEELSEETLNAINAVNWRAVVLGMRERRGYSFSQLEDLELETELLLYGLITPDEFAKRIQNEMQITKEETSELINLLNRLVFQKIREELIKISEANKAQKERAESTETNEILEQKTVNSEIEEKEVFEQSGLNITQEENKNDAKTPIFSENREEMLAGVEKPETIVTAKKQEETKISEPKPSFVVQKLSGSFQMPKTETLHTDNKTENGKKERKEETKNPITTQSSPIGSGPTKIDPYRESIE
jgi:hypothetical protein